MSGALEELRGIYETYYAAMEEKRRSLKPGQGMFGVGGGLADAPCNETFICALELFLARRAADLDGGQAKEAIAYIFDQSGLHRQPQAVYWMLLAAQGMVTPLIPLLDPADAGELAERYESGHPRGERFPAQKKMLALLKAQASR